MKKLQKLSIVIIGIAALSLSACMKHAENVGDAMVTGESRQSEKTDGLLASIDGLLDDAELLEALNDIDAVAHSPLESVLDSCDLPAVRAFYTERAFQKVLIRPSKDRSVEAMAEIEKIPNHGRDLKPEHGEKLAQLMEEHAKDKVQTLFAWEKGDGAAMAKALTKRGYASDGKKIDADSLIAELKGPDCQSILPRYCDFVSAAQADMKQNAKRLAEQDVLLTCELLRWAKVLKLNHPENDYAFDRFRPYVSDEAILEIRSRVFLNDLAKRGPKLALASLQSQDPQYAKLMQAREIYTKAIEAGGWPEVKNQPKAGKAVAGKAYPYIPSLRARLKAEGYSAGPEGSDILDDQLIEAIELYREVHQLSPKNLIDPVLFRNLAVGPEARLATIDLTLQRYRESAIGSLHYYLKINVPDFHAELWNGNERLTRVRIVVGNNDLQRDAVTKKPVPDPETQYPLHPNRTPLQTSKINEIIFNPYWNVPARIRIEELEPKLAENPNYYAENNYEEVNVDQPKLYYVRELPNPKNSLGVVKFMFPNPHNTYLHDTPFKGIFKNAVRGNSHGCMRMQNPLDFAQLLLERDGQWDAAYVEDVLQSKPPVQTSIFLKHPVDVDVVYFNARVDDSGVVAFLSDLYKYDAVREGRVVLKKLPKP